MATLYRCGRCGRNVLVGVPVHSLTLEVSEALSREFRRPVAYHDWSPSATDRALREQAEKLWQEKCDEYFRRTGSLRTLPESCAGCGATLSWEIAIAPGPK